MQARSYVKLTLFFATLFLTIHSFAFSFGSLFEGFHKHKARPRVTRNVVDKRKHIKVGVYVLHVGKYDLQSATTPMDFYLIFKCNGTCKSMNFEIMNATSASIHLVASHNNYLIYRVEAALTKADNLRNYPFDSHTLDIIIENRQMTSDNMIFEADPNITALDSNLCVPGFQLLPTWTAKVSEHYYQVFKQTYSSYKFTMYIKRPIIAGLLKGILPALIIISCSILALFMGIEHTSQRLSIATSTLIAAVVFHLNLTASLPPLGYVTYADTFMLINYFCLLAVLFQVVLTSSLHTHENEAKLKWFNSLFAKIIPISWLVLQIITWIIYNPTQIVSVSH